MPLKPIICIDFDGVLNNYNGYDGDNLGTPRPGAKEFLEKLKSLRKVERSCLKQLMK